MKLKLFSKCDCDPTGQYDCGGYDYFILELPFFKIKLFNDNGMRFLDIFVGQKRKRWMW